MILRAYLPILYAAGLIVLIGLAAFIAPALTPDNRLLLVGLVTGHVIGAITGFVMGSLYTPRVHLVMAPPDEPLHIEPPIIINCDDAAKLRREAGLPEVDNS